MLLRARPRAWQPKQVVQPIPEIRRGLLVFYCPAFGRDLAQNIYPSYGGGIKPGTCSPGLVGLAFDGSQSTTDAWFGTNLFAGASVAGCVALFRLDVFSGAVFGAWGADPSYSQVLFIEPDGDGKIVMAVYDGGGNVEVWRTETAALVVGRTHCVAVKLQSGVGAKAWVDGIQYSTVQLFGYPTWTMASNPGGPYVQLGCSQYEASITGWVGFVIADVVGWPDELYQRASRNIWSMVEGAPPRLRGLVTLSGIYRPSGDVTTSGWTATPGPDHYDMVDESVADDANYITSPTLDGSAYSEIQTLNGTVPAGTYAINIRAKTNEGTGTLRVYLLDSSNVSQGVTADQTIDTTLTTYSLSITTTGAATRIKYEVQ